MTLCETLTMPDTNHDIIPLLLTNEKEINDIVTPLKHKTSYGVDDISARLENNSFLSPLNKSLKQGHYLIAVK